MHIYRPYVYLIQHKSTGMFYIGSKYSRTTPTSPYTFWTKYFTSSKTVLSMLSEGSVDDWDTHIVYEGTGPEDVLCIENLLVLSALADHKCLNVKPPLAQVDPQHTSKLRKIPDGSGITSCQKGAKRGVKTKQAAIVGGLNTLQRAYCKSIATNPELNNIRSRLAHASRSRVNPETGLNSWQQAGQRIIGDANPSKRPEVAQKISISRKKYISENRDMWNQRQRHLNDVTLKTPDENGLTAHDRHSLWMKENNPTTGSKWYNNGTHSVRIKDGDPVPDGYVVGRIKTPRPKSEYYNNGTRNIRVSEGQPVPDGFVKGKLLI